MPQTSKRGGGSLHSITTVRPLKGFRQLEAANLPGVALLLASDNDGTISQMQFYSGSNLLSGTKYNLTWSNRVAGKVSDHGGSNGRAWCLSSIEHPDFQNRS